ncbi:hypothetical protein [Deinococcus knuensis]|uniref:Uncharacterized protein n=1 Tax=Deinococcus knuensis TaxID=1837380 RepID=A0ABQ2SHC2_9DEIO|nr:hypothetical protein [Deinococcus knuensis]GGS25864.1 hypothetical protein GCM10008961_16690 [Deinococcus knuensis]
MYPNLAAAAQGNVRLVSQIALPEAACRAVYADTRYSGSVRNLNSVTLASDNVFSDGAAAQTPRMSGAVTAGYAASLLIGLKN